MTAKRIFITGASGCIGHYIAEALIKETNHELFFLVRNPDKLKFDYEARPGITIYQADLREIEQCSSFLKTIDVAILAATAWGGQQESFDINVVKTLRLIELLDPRVCEQVIYFSTASILDRNNQLLKEAGQLGTDYIRSKYDCLKRLSKLTTGPKITALFPTLVVGGDENKPYSHLSSGIPDVAKWAGLIRWFKADGSFHFIHAQDIAKVVKHLVDYPPPENLMGEIGGILSNQLVLGNAPLTANRAVEELCAYLGKKIYFRLPLSLWLANLFIELFRIQMAAWDRFCLDYRDFTYQNPVNPETFGLPTYCPTFTDVLKVSGI
ncbi:MAG TPA: epimerase [Cyanobacteria bacterium UBA11149]|nr:epimerase [Cyanobacteria bacterium UBA11367]HBE56897.1 epimerase [Cyanobacteria bacterium UBA11366]HBK64581.1 epimerase [Cyanobacteria bacterium UBA11166]HBR75928.1 epimerase [Cyanobacteria bacterium UBA11159]HBS69696.1 epimerase [Cyanobacteria bacterium UBA11153]HBW92175.1 epimerase [Cyanobacteria bacterium UBA11149]HCA95330.1 epimerase [Cyanobacteria bacterium UBA9226]